MVLAYLTGGASLPANLAETATSQAAKQIISSPMFWDTFIKSYGGAYGQAVESGTGRGEAITSAILEAIPTAIIEMSGGIEALPGKAGKQGLLKTILETGKEEGIEEIIQYPFGGAAKKATYAPNTPIFSTTEEAVVNPLQMLEGGAIGAILGGVMGGVGNIASGENNPSAIEQGSVPQNYDGVQYDQKSKTFKSSDGQTVNVDLNNISRSGIENVLNSGIDEATAVPVSVYDIIDNARKMAESIDTVFPQIAQMAKALPETTLSRQMVDSIEQNGGPTMRQIYELVAQIKVDSAALAEQNGSGVDFTEQESSSFVPVEQDAAPVVEQQVPDQSEQPAPIQPTIQEPAKPVSDTPSTVNSGIPVQQQEPETETKIGQAEPKPNEARQGNGFLTEAEINELSSGSLGIETIAKPPEQTKLASMQKEKQQIINEANAAAKKQYLDDPNFANWDQNKTMSNIYNGMRYTIEQSSAGNFPGDYKNSKYIGTITRISDGKSYQTKELADWDTV
jgi:hypothetical protein